MGPLLKILFYENKKYGKNNKKKKILKYFEKSYIGNFIYKNVAILLYECVSAVCLHRAKSLAVTGNLKGILEMNWLEIIPSFYIHSKHIWAFRLLNEYNSITCQALSQLLALAFNKLALN